MTADDDIDGEKGLKKPVTLSEMIEEIKDAVIGDSTCDNIQEINTNKLSLIAEVDGSSDRKRRRAPVRAMLRHHLLQITINLFLIVR